MKQHLTSIPDHGLVWFAVPKGSGLRSVSTCCGKTLTSQFLPAAFDNTDVEGLLLACVPAGTTEVTLSAADTQLTDAAPFAAFTDGYLRVETSEGVVTLEDSLTSFQLCQEGTYSIFASDCAFTAYDGPLFDVTRVITTPVNDDGLTIKEVKACYDFIRMKTAPLMQTFTSFCCENSWPVSNLDLFQMQLKKDAFTSWSAGLPACGGTFDKDPETHQVPILQPTYVLTNATKSYDIMFEHYFSVVSDAASFALVGGEMHAAYNEPHKKLGTDYWTIGQHHMGGAFDLYAFNAANPMMTTLVLGEAAKSPAEWYAKQPAVIQLADDTAADVTVEAGDMKVTLYKTADGVRLNGLWDKKTGRRWLANGSSPLFTATLRNVNTSTNVLVSSLAGWGKVELTAENGGAKMVFSGAKCAPGIVITMKAEPIAEFNEIAWTGDIAVESDVLTLTEFDYPQLNFDAPDTFSMATPYQSGKLYPDTALCNVAWNNEYSNLWCPMQMLTVWDSAARRGLYYTIEDPEPYAKRVKLYKHFAARGSMDIAFVGVNAGIAGNSQALTGRAIWRLYDGDWYDTAIFYRNWMRANATWMPKLNEKGRRADQPDWIYDIGIWTHTSVGPHNRLYNEVNDPEGTWADPTIELQKKVGVPVTVHLYNWHMIPFDTCYPHYFPIKDATLTGVRKLHAAGMRVMPYINGRLWDIDDDHTPMYTGQQPTRTFAEHGHKSATTDWHNKIIEERYGSKHPDGTLVRLNGACLTQPSWHEVVRELCDRMYKEVEVDGVYLDQMSGSGVGLCCNPEHGHPIGLGGKWWMDGCNAMMERVREVTPEYGFYTSEENAEVYANLLQGQLVWHWSSGSLLPMYNIVYSDIIALFGRNYPSATVATKWDRMYHRITFAESLMFGDQLAWNTNFLTNPGQTEEDLEFYYKAIRMRYEQRDYFQHGLLMHPPVISCDEPEMVVQQTTDYNASALHGGPICASMWKHEYDGSMLLTVANITDKDLDSEISLEYTCDLPDGEYAYDGFVSGKIVVKDNKFTLTMPKLSVIMAVIPAK